MKEPTKRALRIPAPVSRRGGVENQSRKSAATEVTEWLEGVLADPALASAVENRLAEMKAEQRREATRASGRPRQRLGVPPRGPVPHGEARSRRKTSTKRREQAPFVVVTPYPNPSAMARRLGMKAEDVARLDELVEARCERGVANRNRAKSTPKRRTG